MFVLFLSLSMIDVKNGNESRSRIGLVMTILIAIIIGRCLVDMVVGLVQTVNHIRNYCCGSKKVQEAIYNPDYEKKAEPKKRRKRELLENSKSKLLEKGSIKKNSDELDPESSVANIQGVSKIEGDESYIDNKRSIHPLGKKLHRKADEEEEEKQHEKKDGDKKQIDQKVNAQVGSKVKLRLRLNQVHKKLPGKHKT